MVTVRGSADSVESRLTAGLLRCPCCGGRLARWGHARRRLVAMGSGWEEFWPRRSRCRGCGRTHVLLPADLWSRRRYGAAVVMTVLMLAAQAAAAGRAVARPWAAAPGGGRRAAGGGGGGGAAGGGRRAAGGGRRAAGGGRRAAGGGWSRWKASPFPDCGNCVFLSRYLRFQELVADLLRRPVPVRRV